MKNKRYLILFLAFIIACRDENNGKVDQSTLKVESQEVKDTSEMHVYALMRTALTTGDTNAYRSARNHYWMNEDTQNFFYTSLVMANKYHFVEAYYDTYSTLAHPYTGEELEGLDEETKNLALYYLLRAFEKHNKQAQHAVKIIFKEKKIPSSSFYLLELAKNK